MASAFLRLSLPVLFVLLATLPVHADPHEDALEFEVDTRGFPAVLSRPLVNRPPVRGEASWSRFQAKHPNWTARWNERTGMPLRITGPGIAVGRVATSAALADDIARDFLVREAAMWVEAGQLKLLRASQDRSGWWVQYMQTYRGLRVVGGRAFARLSGAGSVPLFGLQLEPGVEAETTPVLDKTAAESAALADFPPGTVAETRSVELVVLPVSRNGKTAFRTAYQIDFTTREPFGAWTAYIDAATGDVLWRHSTLRTIDLTGSVSAGIEPVTAGDSIEVRALPYVNVTLSDSIAETVTDSNGNFLIAAPGGGPHTLGAGLAGPFGRIVNLTFGGETPHLEFPFDPDSTTTFPILFDDGNSRIQDRDAFYWVMRSRDYIQEVDPAFTALDYPMYILTDFPNAQCNAFWDGYGVTFFAQGITCPSMARLASVVIHEYGHGITDYQYRPFSPSSDMHEGFSDYFSATLLDDPRIGLGFFGEGTVLRNVDNDLRYPDDASQDPHITGLIIAGALWDVREALGPEIADQLWHFSRNGLSENFDDYFFDYLVTDDQDGNVYNGTPHFDTIVPAFQRHGIGDYEIHVAHTHQRDTENPNQTFTLTASFLSIFAIDDASVKVHLSIATGTGLFEETRTLLPTGGVREYSTVLQAQPAESIVSYWFTAQDTTGRAVTYPPGGAQNPIVFRIGTDTTPPVIAHDALRNQPVDGPGVVFRAGVTDNLDKGVDTVRVLHARGNDQAFVTLEPTGSDQYAGAVVWPSLELGETIRYRIQVADSAAVPNHATFPDTGWSEFGIVRGFGRDFESSDGGLIAEGGWEWGSPEPLVHAFSGQYVWGTSLGSFYPDNAVATLIVGPVDLSQFTTAGLYFQHYYDTEVFYDGGAVFASTDSGATWELVVPDGEYPLPEIDASGEPGYSGDSGGWKPAAFALDAYVGVPNLHLKLEFRSDVAVGGLGWFVDDLEVVERQVLSRPLELTAQSGNDGEVPLAWKAPAGVDPEAPNTLLLGFHVYRGIPGETPVRITDLPVPGLEYVDNNPVNGLFYEYSVRAVYEDGESLPSNVVQAIPYLAALSTTPDSLAVSGEAGETASAALHLANTGTGFLEVNVWPAESGQTLDDVRIRYRLRAGSGFSWGRGFWANTSKQPRPIAPPGEWHLVHKDPQDHADAVIPDIDSVQVQVGFESFYIRVTGHRSWGDINNWTLHVALDTDLDPGTHPDGDFALIAGAPVVNALGVPAVILDHLNQRVGPVHHVTFPAPHVMEFGIFLASIEDPEEMFLTFRSLTAGADSTLDQVPDDVELPWLTPERHRVVLFQGEDDDVPLTFAGLSAGDYEGQLLLETNDPAHPVMTIPVTYDVIGGVPVDLLSFEGRAEDMGIRLEWSTVQGDEMSDFQVLRSQSPGGLETVLGQRALPNDRSVYVFEDRDLMDGQEYWYRLKEMDRTGGVRFHGPVQVRYTGVSGLTSVALRPSMPNPTRGTATIRFGLPADATVSLRMYSVEGRLVRVLADRVAYGRGFHELSWDGRDSEGRLVSPGVFPYLLDASGATRRGKITVLR